MYYATYGGIGKSDVAAFRSEKERDEWVNYEDAFSKMFGTTKENAFFSRVALIDEKEIKEVVNDTSIAKVIDTYNPQQIWYLRSLSC